VKPHIAIGLGGVFAWVMVACAAHEQDDATGMASGRSVGEHLMYPDGKACQAPHAQTCAFYSACVEAEHPCGTDGYALGYGEKYCERFMSHTNLSERGNAWRDATMACLQQELIAFIGSSRRASCEALSDAAFASHPACYTQVGHSICSLPMTDVWAILRTLDGPDTFSLRAAKQIRSVIATCLETPGIAPGSREAAAFLVTR